MLGIGKTLKALRKENNFSTKDVCDKLKNNNQNFSEHMLHKWEEDKNEPNIYTLIALAKIFKVSLTDIFEGKNDTISNKIYNLTPSEIQILDKYRKDKYFKNLAMLLLRYVEN